MIGNVMHNDCQVKENAWRWRKSLTEVLMMLQAYLLKKETK